jgi:Chaperone of endosialidase
MTPSVHCQKKTIISTHRRLLLDLTRRFIVLAGLLACSVNSLQGQSDALYINDKGNLGVGTANPAVKFQVHTENYDFLTNPFTADIVSSAATGAWTRAFRIVRSTSSDGKDGGAFGLTGEGNTPGYAYMSLPTKDASGFDSTKILVLNNAGNVGLGTLTPGFPLTFPNQLGDKISLWGQSGVNYGFGVQGSLLQIHSDTAESDIAFGYGKSGTPESKAFTETMRIKGNGNLSVGDELYVRSRTDGTSSITQNAFTTLGSIWNTKDAKKNAFTLELRDSGVLDLYGTKTAGKLDWLQMAHFDAPNNQISFPSSAPVIVRGRLYAGGGFAYFWGPDNKWYGIEHGGGGPLSSSKNAEAAPSDMRLKTDVQAISSALEKIDRLRGVTFHWNEQGLRYLTRDIETSVSAGPAASDEENRKAWHEERDKRYTELSAASVGVVAQDVESVLPEAVTTDETGYRSVKYYQLIPLVIEALKEEDKITREQAQVIVRQQGEIESLRAAAHAAEAQLTELSDLKRRLAALATTVETIKSTGLSMTATDQLHTDEQPAGSQ